MKHVLKVSRHLKSPKEALSHHPLWISDALLNETFNRFSKGCRRHGSHVPGPLEARRRTTRRKNTSIAYNGAAQAPIDVAGLLGPGKNGGWWKQPHVGEEPPILPRSKHAGPLQLGRDEVNSLERILSWFESPPPTAPEAKTEEFETPTVESRYISKTQLKALEVDFQQKLHHARRLEDIRVLLRNRSVTTSQGLVFPTLALQHVLESKWSLKDIKEFLLDPVLNPRGAQLIRVVEHALKSKWLDQTNRAGLFNVICEWVSLGAASPQQVKHIIRGIPQFKIFQENSLVVLGNEQAIIEYYQKILLAIHECNGLTTEDLGREFMFTWFRDISSRPFTPMSAELLWKLRQYAGQPENDVAVSILFRLFPHGLSDRHNPVQETDFGKFFATLSPAIMPHVLVKVTQSIIALPDCAGGGKEHMPILRWHELLASLPVRKLRLVFTSTESWRDCLAEPGKVGERAQRAVIACWVAVSMSKEMEQAESHLKRLPLKKFFEDLYLTSKENGVRDVLARFLETLQSLPLPNTSLLLDRLRFVTDGYIIAHNKDFALLATEKDLLRRFSLLQNVRDYDRFRMNFNDALIDLAESINQDLSSFMQVSRSFIDTDAAAFEVIARVLKHNLALQRALSRSWPTSATRYRNAPESPSQPKAEQDVRSVTAAPHSRIIGSRDLATQGPTKSSSQNSPFVNPRTALDLINHLAISCATSPASTPRQAVRRVYWCYQMLHKYGAPVETPITRALWHAAVTRQGKNGTATTLLRWIIKQIRIVEGDAVADMMVRSAGFRTMVERQFVGLPILENGVGRKGKGGEVAVGELQRYEAAGAKVGSRKSGICME